jgi:hypothetical protein
MRITRRDFLGSMLAASAMVSGVADTRAAVASAPTESASAGPEDRAAWMRIADRVARPVLAALADRRLKAAMPVEGAQAAPRRAVTHLEALGRTLCGLAPWLEYAADAGDLPDLARAAIASGVDPASPDRLNFTSTSQPLVDAAFLAQALLRAPQSLWTRLEPRTQIQVLEALESTRAISPAHNNWELFAAIIEAFLQRAGRPRDERRLFAALRDFQTWYVGDGVYGDGPEFHWDSYNAFVIQPILVEILDVVGDEASEWREFRQLVHPRFVRYAEIQERLIAPDGSFPPLGRSLAYRCGAFQGLALAALRHVLPPAVPPAQARRALSAVIRRTLEAPGTFDENGWLRIGLAGHQPSLGETYISTGSLYLCTAAFLPLGLPPDDPFWTGPSIPTTWETAWSGRDLPADHARRELRTGASAAPGTRY